MDEQLIREIIVGQARMEEKLDAHSKTSSTNFENLTSEVRGKHKDHEERIRKAERKLNIFGTLLGVITAGGTGVGAWLKGG
jgi:molybdopterin biosynthesis enzyme MoaB